tara:strand:+ start:567 stop:776 length:210 start_codon:yes stop_codon:yes gene_type:complete
MEIEDSTFQKLIDALERNADEMVNLQELLAPEISRTESINRRVREKLEAEAEAEKFIRKYQNEFAELQL